MTHFHPMLLASAVALSAPPACGNRSAWLENTVIGDGHNLHTIRGLKDAAACCAACDGECGAWTFHPAEAGAEGARGERLCTLHPAPL